MWKMKKTVKHQIRSFDTDTVKRSLAWRTFSGSFSVLMPFRVNHLCRKGVWQWLNPEKASGKGLMESRRTGKEEQWCSVWLCRSCLTFMLWSVTMTSPWRGRQSAEHWGGRTGKLSGLKGETGSSVLRGRSLKAAENPPCCADVAHVAAVKV